MKTIKNTVAISVITAALMLGSCFSPYAGDEGSVTLYLGGTGASVNRSIAYTPGVGPGADDITLLEYVIHLNGPGGSRTETARGGGSITVPLTPGRWTVQADAYYNGMLYAISDPLSIEVTAGGRNSAIIQMRPAAQQAWNNEDFGANAVVHYWYLSVSEASDELEYVFSRIGDVPTPGNHVVIVEGEHALSTTAITIESGVTISLRGSSGILKIGSAPQLFDINGGKLIIRGPTLQGDNVTGTTNPLVKVTNGNLTMHSGAIRGHKNTIGICGGVRVSSGGSFTMHGGSITDNISSNGGGVYLDGPFTMNGGTISNNTSSGSGGGVFVGGAAFTMNSPAVAGIGGNITDNMDNNATLPNQSGATPNVYRVTYATGTISGTASGLVTDTGW